MYRYKSAKQEYGRREEVEESATKTRRKREDRLDSTLQRGAYGHGMDKDRLRGRDGAVFARNLVDRQPR